MNNINETQIQLTNDASTISKYSTVSKNYYKDDFIQEFVVKKKSRASLIHLGYYTRATVLNKLIIDFIEFANYKKFSKFQIISLGAGFDTAYWRLSEANLLSNCVFVEIDFPDVIQKKIKLIKRSQKLRMHLMKNNFCEKSNGAKKLSSNYYLFEADLSEIALIEKLFEDIKIDYEIPTLFLSECVITYMKESDSRKLIDWMSGKFKNCGFVNYEQIHPDDGFGQVMINHFDRLQSSLFSVSKYPDCKSHYIRFENHGFESRCCMSEWDALVSLTSEEERKRVFSLELFDEFEEFHLKCVHYVVAVAGNGTSSEWISAMSFPNTNSDAVCRPRMEGFSSECDLELFRHFSCGADGVSYVFGGCSRRNRSCEIYEISYGHRLDIKLVKKSDQNVRLDMVYGSGVCFELNQLLFVCLYGGRTSPDKVWNDGSPVVCELVAGELFQRLVVREGNPTPRYRTAMVSLRCSESEVSCWIFGGRGTDLNVLLSDFWKLSIKYDNNKKNLSAKWSQQQKTTNSWPSARMSHSFTACPERLELFLIGGFSMATFSALNDVWKWRCSDSRWEKVELSGRLLPRYGHTAHLKDDIIYLVGGVNTMAGAQPGLARIDLKNLTVTEYEISSPALETTLLINHTSQIVQNGDEARLCIIGGGGNCFSFGTHINRSALCIRLDQIS